MARIFFATPELPHPARSGGRIKSRALLDAFAAEHDVTLCCPLKGDDPEHVEDFRRAMPDVRLLAERVDRPRSARNLLRSYGAGRTLNMYRSWSPELARRAAESAPRHDLVFVDHYEMGQYLPAECGQPVVYHAHNAYHQLWSRFAAGDDRALRAFVAQLESRRVRTAELALVARADAVLASPNDIRTLVDAGADPDRCHVTYHLGDPASLALPRPRWENTSKRLLFVGFLGWQPNADGMSWFLDAVWPLLKARHPTLELDIAGDGADDALRARVACTEGVHLHGFVEDLGPLYAGARVSIAPLRFGSGMKVKVLDAMARGMPTVTTFVGAEGLDVGNGIHLSVAREPETMARQVDRLLRSKRAWSAMSTASRTLIRERYGYRRLLGRHLRLIAGLLRARPSGSAQQAGSRPCPVPVSGG